MQVKINKKANLITDTTYTVYGHRTTEYLKRRFIACMFVVRGNIHIEHNRLRWHGHVKKRNNNEIVKKVREVVEGNQEWVCQRKIGWM